MSKGGIEDVLNNELGNTPWEFLLARDQKTSGRERSTFRTEGRLCKGPEAGRQRVKQSPCSATCFFHLNLEIH